MKKRILTILMAFVMVSFSPMFGGIGDVYAGTNGYTQESAVAYANGLVGKKWDVDNGSYDCVDIAKKYFKDVGGMAYMAQGNAGVYATTAQIPSGWQRMYMANGYTPQPGDVAAWAIGAYQWSYQLPYGHVGIVVAVSGNTITIVDQDSTTQRAAARNNYRASDVTCFIHPNFSGSSSPSLNFTAVDIGTGFYGSIVNLAANKPIKVSGTNVVMGVRNGSNEQKWKFERQSDTSYKIINVATGQCLDDDNYGTTDNTNIKVCGSNDDTAQRWYFRANGNGYSLVPKCALNLAMDMTDGNSTEGHNVAAWTFVSNNPNQIFGIDKQPSFEPLDIGTNFYGSIVNLAANKPIKVSGGNVVMGVRNGSNEQKWKFVRVDDRMYKIINVATGQCLDDDNYGTTDNTNIKVCGSNDDTAQRWYFRANGNGYSLVPKCAMNLAMDMTDGNSTEGHNVAAWTFVSNNPNQIFGIDRQPSFEPVDLGKKFTAVITHVASGSAVTEDGSNNVSILQYGKAKNQLWVFEQVDDRMYKISNYATGHCLDTDNYGSIDGTNIKAIGSNDTSAQRWYLRSNGNGYSLVPKCSMNLCMDLVSGNSTDGNNLELWTIVDKNVNQIFILQKVDPNSLNDQTNDPVDPSTTTNPANQNNPAKPSTANPVNPANGASEGASAAAVTKYLTTRQDDSDAPGSTYGKLTARVSKAGKTSQKVVWNAVPGAVKYNLYANKCGKTNKLIFLGSVTETSFTHKGLKKGTYYKYMVVAVDKNERVAASSKVVHSATAGGKVGNFKKVKTAAKKNKVNLKTGKKFKLKAKGVKGKGKVKKHRAICYESSNPAIATVSKKGVIKGVAPGKCIVYAYAQNGVYKKIKVVVR